MADAETKKRKRDDQLDDDLDLGSLDDLSLDDPDAGNGTSSGKSRKPDSPTKTMVVEGLKGIGSGSKFAVKRELYKAMPNLESVANEISSTYSEFKDLKDELGRTLSPMLLSLETSARKVLPKAKELMPKKLYSAIEKKLKARAESREASSYTPQSKEQRESETIANELALIFTQQQELSRTTALEAKKSELVNMAVEGARHKRTTVALSHLYDSQRSVELFHRTVHTAYLKKSLELKYKHLFVARDTFNLLSKSLATFESYFKALEKNTMLPDMAKIEIGDYHRKNVTQRYGEMMADFMGNIRKKLIGNIKNAARGAVQGFGTFADMASMGADMSSMADGMDFGEKPKGIKAKAAGWAGRALGYFVGGPAAKRMLGKVSPITKDLDKSLGDMKANAALKLSTLGRKWGNSGNPILSMLSGLIPQLNARRSGENTLLSKPDAPATFDNATRQSIVEIIPGYLSKMLHSMEKQRTGDDNVEQTVYNAYSRKFTTVGELENTINQRMYGSDEARAQNFAATLGTLSAGYKHAGRGDAEEYYKEIKPDINRFMVNHGINRDGLRVDEIAKYVVSGGTEGDLSYIDRVCEGFKNDRLKVLQGILDGLKNADGSWNKRSVSNLSSQLLQYMRNDAYTSELVNVGEKLGYRHLFSDKVDTKTRRALEGAARKGDTKAAATLKRVTGLFGDENELGLGRIAEGQANINYDQADKYVKTYTEDRTEDIAASDAAHAQMDRILERTGAKRAVNFAKGKYSQFKEAAKDKYDKTYAFVTREGIDLTKKAVKAAKKASKVAGEKYDEYVPEEVKQALTTIKSYAGVVPEEAAKMLHRIERVYQDKVPESIREDITAVREEIKTKMQMRNVGRAVTDSINQSIIAHRGAAEPGTATSTPTGGETDWEQLVNKASSVRPTRAYGAPVITPTASVITGPEQVELPRPEAASTVGGSDTYDLLQKWHDLYKYNSEFQQEQLQELQKYMSDEHGTIFDAVAQVDETLRNKTFGTGGAAEPGSGVAAVAAPGGGDKRRGKLGRILGRGANAAGAAIKGIGKVYTRTYGAALKGAGSAIGGISSAIGSALGKDGFVTKAGKKVYEHLPDILNATGSTLKNIGKGYVNLYGKAIGAVGGIGKAVASGLFGKGVEPFVDIYRKDEIGGTYKPILTKVRQERGVFFKDGKRVKQSVDIKEPVYDSEGKEIITKEDIDHGIVGADNKPIGSGGGAREGLVSKALGALKAVAPGVGKMFASFGKMYGKAFGGIFDLISGGVKGAGKFINRLLGFDLGGTSKELIELIKLIQADVDMLARGERKGSKAGDADGDGDVDGSYADQMEKRKSKEYKIADASENHVDVSWRKKPEESAGGGEQGEEGESLFSKVTNSKWVKDKMSKNKWLRHGGRRFKALGKVAGKRSLGALGKAGKFLAGKGGTIGRAAMHLGTKIPMLGSLFGAGTAAAGTAATGAAGAAGAATAAGGALAGLGSTLAAVAGPAALAALAGYGLYRGVKGFSKKNTLENIGESNGISNENQLTGEDRMYSALGMNSKIGAKTMKFASKALGIHGLIKGIRGNDNPLTDKEIQQGRNRLNRKIEKGMPGYDRILQEYEKAVTAGNWERARQLSGQEADGLIKSMWKNSLVGMATSGLSKLVFGDKNAEMSQSDIKKVHDKFNNIIVKGGPNAKKAEKLLSKFDDAVADGDWRQAREIAGMEKTGLFGKLFKDSKGNVQWGKLLGTAAFGIAGYAVGALFEKADVNKPMTEKEVADTRARLMKLEQNGNKAAGKILQQFDDAVTEMNWKKARQLVGKEVQSNLAKFGKGLKSTVKWTKRIATLGLSMLFESDQEKPLTEAEIEKVTSKLSYLADAKHNKVAAKKLEKFQEAIAKEKWDVARKIAKMPDKSVAAKAVKSTVSWFFGDDEKEMSEQEMSKFRESCGRKINIGGSAGKAAQKKLDAFEDAVSSQNWRRARKIAGAPDDGIIQKLGKGVGKAAANTFRWFFGGDGKPMSDEEIEKARKRFNGDISDGKKGAQKRLDMFEDYVADEKWEKARKLANMPYNNVVKRAAKAIKGFLFGNDENAMSPEEIKKFQDKCEQQIADGNPKMQKVLDKFNGYVESERWEQARAISGNKDWGVAGSIGKGIKNVWNFLTGNSDYEDCQKIKTKIEEKILDEDDPTGLMSKGLVQMETLIKREKYNDAAKLGEDILKMKPTELAGKYKLESDEMTALTKDAKSLNERIQKGIKKQKGFFNLNRMRLRGLSSQLMSDPNRWSDEFFEDIRSQYAEIAGEDEFGNEDAPSSDESKKAANLVKAIDATSKNFGWFTSPIKKTQLSRLKSEVEGDPNDWYDLKFEEWQKRLKEIAGDKVADPSKEAEQKPAEEKVQTGPEGESTSSKKEGEEFKVAGAVVGEKLTPEQMAAISISEQLGNDITKQYSPEVLEKYRASKSGGAPAASAQVSQVSSPGNNQFYTPGSAGNNVVSRVSSPIASTGKSMANPPALSPAALAMAPANNETGHLARVKEIAANIAKRHLEEGVKGGWLGEGQQAVMDYLRTQDDIKASDRNPLLMMASSEYYRVIKTGKSTDEAQKEVLAEAKASGAPVTKEPEIIANDMLDSDGCPVDLEVIKYYGADKLKKEPWLRDVDFPGDPDEEREARSAYELRQKAVLKAEPATKETVENAFAKGGYTKRFAKGGFVKKFADGGFMDNVKDRAGALGEGVVEAILTPIAMTAFGSLIATAIPLLMVILGPALMGFLTTICTMQVAQWYDEGEYGKIALLLLGAGIAPVAIVAFMSAIGIGAGILGTELAVDGVIMGAKSLLQGVNKALLPKACQKFVDNGIDFISDSLMSVVSAVGNTATAAFGAAVNLGQGAFTGDFDREAYVQDNENAIDTVLNAPQRALKNAAGWTGKGIHAVGKGVGKLLGFGETSETSETTKMATGGFATQTTPAIDADGKPLVYGEAGTEAIMPLRSKPGNLLDRVGKKLGAALAGEDIGPVGDKADEASVHAADPDSEPMTNLLATELAKSAVGGLWKMANWSSKDETEEPAAMANGGFFRKPKPTTADPSLSGPVLQAKVAGVTPSVGQPQFDPTEKLAQQSALTEQLIDQNKQLLNLFQAICTAEGLKIVGMDALTEVTAASASGGGQTVVNNTTVVQGDSEPQGLDLRKRQC